MNSNNKNISQTGVSKTLAFNYQGTALPKFVEKNNKEWVAAGEDNKWFEYLIELSKLSPLHGGIVRSIVDNVKGQGVRIKDGVQDEKLSAFIEKCNKKEESLDDVVAKYIMDYTLFGGFAASSVWNKGKSSFDLYHVDFSTIRADKEIDLFGDVSKYYFSSNWYKSKPDITQYPAFDLENRTGTQIHYVKNCYYPGTLYYPLPAYMQAIPVIEANKKIWVYHNANIDNGFFPSVHVAYHNGIPSLEIQEENSENLSASFEGPTRAGVRIETYDNGGDNKTEITPLNLNNNDSKFLDLANQTVTEMLAGWRIPSGELLSVQQVSKLGGGNIEEAATLLENLLIRPMRKVIEDELNYMLQGQGFTGKIEIVPTEQIRFIIPESLMPQCMTIDEIRKRAGMEPLPHNLGNKLINGTSLEVTSTLITPTTEGGTSSTPANDIQAQAQANLRGSVGGVQGVLQIQQGVSQGLTDYDAAIEMLSTFYGITEDKARILLGKPKLSPEAVTAPAVTTSTN